MLGAIFVQTLLFSATGASAPAPISTASLHTGLVQQGVAVLSQAEWQRRYEQAEHSKHQGQIRLWVGIPAAVTGTILWNHERRISCAVDQLETGDPGVARFVASCSRGSALGQWTGLFSAAIGGVAIIDGTIRIVRAHHQETQLQELKNQHRVGGADLSYRMTMTPSRTPSGVVDLCLRW